jgi:hypothetical protein
MQPFLKPFDQRPDSVYLTNGDAVNPNARPPSVTRRDMPETLFPATPRLLAHQALVKHHGAEE